jgi:hypothetical protein
MKLEPWPLLQPSRVQPQSRVVVVVVPRVEVVETWVVDAVVVAAAAVVAAVDGEFARVVPRVVVDVVVVVVAVALVVTCVVAVVQGMFCLSTSSPATGRVRQ